MANYYVGKDGNDSHTGLSDDTAHRWLTIQKALSVMVAGDTTTVHAGTYNEKISPANSGSAGNLITLQAYPGDNVIVDGTSVGITEYGILTINTSYFTVSGLVFQNSPFFGIMTDADSLTLSHITIQNCTCHNCGCSGIANVTYYDNGLQTGNLTYVTVTGCICYTCNTSNNFESISIVGVNHFTETHNIVYNCNYAAGACIDVKVGCLNGTVAYNSCYSSTCPGIYLDARSAENTIAIYNNLIYGCSTGVSLADESSSYVLSAISIYDNIIYNCGRGLEVDHYGTETITFTFIDNSLYNNDSGGQQILIANYTNLSSCVIRDNVLSSSTNGIYAIYIAAGGSGANLVVDHQDYYNSGGAFNGSSYFGTNYITSNPLFVNPTSNFALQAGSPCIGAGSSTGAPSTDYAGNSRNSPPCIGAYEYIAGSSPPIIATVMGVNI